MARISSDLREEFERDPNAIANVIVMVQNEAATYVGQMSAMGLSVRRTFTLIRGLALSGPASAVLSLAAQPWVVSIEEDKPVHTM